MIGNIRSTLTGSVRRLDRFLRSSLSGPRDFPELSVSALEAQPIFDDLPKEHARHLRKSRKDGSWQQMSKTPAQINWASDFDEARKIARAEDKPIFVVTFCRQNSCATRDL